MRLHEFTNPLKHYLATVRVVLRGASSTVRTTITADTASDAKKLLAAIVGDCNVLSLSHIVTEAPQSDQIQREQAIRPQAVCRRALSRKVAQTQPSSVAETETKTRVLSPQELQVKALADKAEDYKQQEKALKARQQLAKAQQNLMKATRPKIPK